MNPRDRKLSAEVRLGGIRIWRRRGVVKRLGKAEAVSPKAIQVLDCLLRAGTASVSRNEFIAKVWDDNYVVGEHGLRDAIWELRRVFDDDPKAPRFIQTIPRKGYRLLVKPRSRVMPNRWLVSMGLALLGLVVTTLGLKQEEVVAAPGQQVHWSGSAPVVAGNQEQLAQVRLVNGQFDLFIDTDTYDDFGRSLLGGDPRLPGLQITNSRARETSPVWAPNHADVAFIERHSDDGSCRIKMYRADKNDVVTLASDCYSVVSPVGQVPAQISWSPDGTRIAYQSAAGTDGAAIAVVAIDGGTPTRLSDPGGRVDAFPRWSAIGDLAFVRLADPMMGFGEIIVLNGFAEEILHCRTAPVWGLAWADDRHLAATAALNNPFGLWLIDARTGEVASTGRPARYLQPSRVNGTLLIDRFRDDSPLQKTSLVAESPSQRIDDPGHLLAVAYTPVTGMLAATTDGGQELQLVLISSSGDRQVVHSAREIYRPRFSANGRMLAFSARDSENENAAAFLLDTSDRQVKRLSTMSKAIFFAEWALDGDSYYGLQGVPSPLGHNASLARYDFEGQLLESVAQRASINVVVDQGGNLWWSDDLGVIHRRNAQGQQSVVHELKSVYESWTVDQSTQMLLFTETRREGVEIRSMTRNSSPQTVRSLTNPLDPMVGLAIGPDRSLIFRSNSFVWQDRRAHPVAELLRASRSVQRNWHRCQIPNPYELASIEIVSDSP